MNSKMKKAGLVASAVLVCSASFAWLIARATPGESVLTHSATPERNVFVVHEILIGAKRYAGKDASVYGYVVVQENYDGTSDMWLAPFRELSSSGVGDTIGQLALALRFVDDSEYRAALKCAGAFGRAKGVIEFDGIRASIEISAPDDGVVAFEGDKFKICK